jgi:hypothetical protein
MRLSLLAAVAWMAVSALILSSSATVPAADDPPDGAFRELHVVGLYEGVERTGNELHGGRAVVTVNRPGSKVTLALVSYDSITWDVKVTPDTTLEKVILGGYYKQALKVKPPKAEVVEAWRDEGRRDGVSFGGYKVESARFRGLVHELTKFTKLPISSFYGSYRYDHDKPIVIDKVQDDPRLSADYPKPTPLADLPDLLFRGVHDVSDERGIFTKNSVGDFTLAGVQTDSLKPLPAGVRRIAFDAKAKKYYGITMHEVVEVDLAAAKATKIDMGLDVPRMSWPRDITFDSKRGRVVVAANHLYALDVADGTWSALQLPRDIAALAYHPKHDTYYALAFQHGEDGDPAILRELNAEGAVLGETKLGAPLIPGLLGRAMPTSSARMTAVDEYLVLIGSPSDPGSEVKLPQIDYTFLIEPKTSKIWLTSKTEKKVLKRFPGEE